MYKQKYIYIQPSKRTDGEGKWMGKMAGILETLENGKMMNRKDIDKLASREVTILSHRGTEKITLPNGKVISFECIVPRKLMKDNLFKGGSGSLQRLLIAGCIQRKEGKYQITDTGRWVLTTLRTTHKQVRIPRMDWNAEWEEYFRTRVW